jgi:cytochrome c oxidase cbb3-type subunit 1
MTDDKQADEDVLRRAEIDRSARLPVLFFFTSAAVWLAISVILGFIQSVKLYAPGFLDAPWLFFLNYGRSNPAFMGALVYGWAIQAGMGVAIWLMARLCRAEVKNPLTLVVAGHFWNLGVLIGVIGIFAGYGTSMEWLAFPRAVWPILLAAYSLVVVWLITMFQRREPGEVYISVWYILGACFWFPWVYITANVFIHVLPGAAVAKAATNAWFMSSMIFLVLVPLGLASAYYFIPKILGRPVYSSQLAKIGFWGLAILGGWTGIQKFMGGPLPAWMPAVSGVAVILMLVPILAIAINHHMTLKGNHGLIETSPTMRFTAAGALAFTVFCILSALSAFFSLGQFTQISQTTMAFQLLAVYGFFSLTIFGAIYFIVPRLVGCEWPSGSRIRLHFWFSTYGIISLVVLHFIGGIWQAAAYSQFDAPLENAVSAGRPYAIGASLAWASIMVSNIMFLYHLSLMVLRLGRRNEDPTLLGHQHPAA